MEAAQEEHNENKTVQELKATVQTSRERVKCPYSRRMRAEICLQKEVLQQQISERKDMLKRMDEIYKSAFDGPSPGTLQSLIPSVSDTYCCIHISRFSRGG